MKRKRLYGILVIVCVVLVLAWLFPFSSELELKSLDLRFRLRGDREADSPIVLVTIDDESFDYFNKRWPWPRTIFVDAIRNLAKAGPKAIGLDVMLGDKGFTDQNDSDLAQAIAEAGVVVLPAKFARRETSSFTVDYLDLPLTEYQKAMRSAGYINLVFDADGYVRRLVTENQFQGDTWYPFAVELAALYSGEEPADLAAAINSQFLLINYRGTERGFVTVPLYQIAAGLADPDIFQGKIVLIGAYFKESHDQFLTPYRFVEGMYGVEINAEAIDTILNTTFLKETGSGINAAILIGIVVFSVLFMTGLKPVHALWLMFGLMILYMANGIILFARAGTIVPVFRPLLSVFLSWCGTLIYRYLVLDREKRMIRATFSRFVSPKVVNQILESPENVSLGGELREVVIFFSDICDFTGLSERTGAEDLVAILNRYFEEMAEIIFAYDGTLNKFIGDAIMAFYGAPLDQRINSERAVRACLDMRRRLAELNVEWGERGIPPLRIGMGVHRGEVLAGNIGSPRQMEYTIIGDAVNVCSRIESLTRPLSTDLLISDEVYGDIADLVLVETPKRQEVKGKSGKIKVHKVLGLQEEGGA